MAGDFIMVQCATPRKPEVLRIAQQLEIPVPHAFGLCIQAWIWFDEQTEDGHAIGVTSVTLDSVVCHAGFAQSLIDVGWLQAREGALQVPNFDQHMGQSAKKRAKDNKRQQKHRHKSVTQSCDKNVTKEEKRREEKNTPYPLLGFSQAFQMAWDLWPAKRRSKREAAQSGWNDAVAKLQIRHGGDCRKAEDWLFGRVREFVKSPKACGKYCTAIANWLIDGNYDDAPESWLDGDEDVQPTTAYQEIPPV